MAWHHKTLMWVANTATKLLPPELRQTLVGAGRLTVPQNANPLNWFNWLPRKYQNAHNIDITKLQRYSADELLEMLVSTHPDVSFALHTFLRMGSTQMTASAQKSNGNKDVGGQRVVDEIVSLLNTPLPSPGYQHGRTIDKIDVQQRMMVYIRGACAGEVVLNESATDPIDIAPVDPWLIWFRRDPETNRLIPYQFVQIPVRRDGEEWYGNYKKIDTPLFIYEELDAMVDDPYGRSPILPVLQVIFFHLQVLADLKAVVHNQGYPRIMVSLVEEIMLKNLPAQIGRDTNAIREWMNARMDEVRQNFSNLNPDDALFGWDSVKFDYLKPSGGGGSSMIDVKALINVIDTQIATGCKTLLTLLSRHVGSTETYSSVDVQLYIKTVESARDVTRRFWERALSVAARVKGVQTAAKVEYAPIDLRSEQDVQKDVQLHLQNITSAESNFFITSEEAAHEARIALRLNPVLPAELKELLKAKSERRANPTAPEQPNQQEEGGDNQDATTND